MAIGGEMKKNIGVLLSGSGHLDGAEIREAVLTLLSIEELAHNIIMFAPNVDQFHTINHLTGEEMNEKRNVLVESARIARGKIKDIKDVKAEDLDALLIPGGFGAAKNLSSFAFKGSQGEVIPSLKELILNLHAAKKPIGAVCIAPAILALVLGSKNVKITIGCDNGTKEELHKAGALHEDCGVREVSIDYENRIVTAPAYMYDDANLFDIYQGIRKCVHEVIGLIN